MRRTLPALAILLVGCGAYNPPVPPAIAQDVQGRRIIVQTGCLERTLVDNSSAEDYADDFPGRYYDDGILDTLATAELLAGLTKGLTDPRIVIDSSTCPTAAGALRFPLDKRKDTASFSPAGLERDAIYLARGPLFFYDLSVPEPRLHYSLGANGGKWSSSPFPSRHASLGVSMGYVLYDARQGTTLHQGVVKGKSGTDFIIIKLSMLTRRDWEAASRRIGAALQKQLLQALDGR